MSSDDVGTNGWDVMVDSARFALLIVRVRAVLLKT